MMALQVTSPSTTIAEASRLQFRALPLICGAVLTLVVALIAIAPRQLDPTAISLSNRLTPPLGFGGTTTHILGTDSLGRDVLARVVTGARISLLIAVFATIGAGSLGVVAGVVAGYLGGRWESAISWLSDVQMALPFVVVAIAMAATFRPSTATVILVLTVTGWATYARVARAATRSLRSSGFVESARVSGANEGRIVARHVLPVIAPALIILACQQAGAMILYESALSFLGLGVPAGTITWGGMIADARDQTSVGWWITVAPGLAIVCSVIVFNALGRWFNRRALGYQ
jgi:peptide/nickel transport system permease protein